MPSTGPTLVHASRDNVERILNVKNKRSRRKNAVNGELKLIASTAGRIFPDLLVDVAVPRNKVGKSTSFARCQRCGSSFFYQSFVFGLQEFVRSIVQNEFVYESNTEKKPPQQNPSTNWTSACIAKKFCAWILPQWLFSVFVLSELCPGLVFSILLLFNVILIWKTHFKRIIKLHCVCLLFILEICTHSNFSIDRYRFRWLYDHSQIFKWRQINKWKCHW